MPIELWKLTVPATSVTTGPDFIVLPKRQCQISCTVETDDSKVKRIALLFEGVESFKCTYLTSCTAEMFNLAYGKLVRLETTQWLTELLQAHARVGRSIDKLQHLMICFDDGPCYEIICQRFFEQTSENV